MVKGSRIMLKADFRGFSEELRILKNDLHAAAIGL
jgi:hypothetical protein